MDKSIRCDVPHLRKVEVENWLWSTIIQLAEKPEQIEAEVAQRREDAEREPPLTPPPMAGLEKGITRGEAQKAEWLDVYPNHGNVGKLITRQAYETKAAQMAAAGERLKA